MENRLSDERKEEIEKICKHLEKNWKEVPEQRLGQFLINYIFIVKPITDAPMWHQKDEKTLIKFQLWRF